MYIESPQFPHRRVVHDNHQIRGGFGFERAQLASYVADQLNNNHRNDAAILQKFRKQAEQYKRNLLRRKHNKPAQVSSQPNFVPQPSFTNHEVPSSMSIKLTKQDMRVSTSHSEANRKKQEPKQQQYHKSPIIIREVQRAPNEGNRQLIKMLQRKDKMIEKQIKIISKNERKMSELKRRIQILEQQNRIKENNRLASLQTDSYSKIRQFISSMSNKLLENQSLIEQNLISGRNSNRNGLVLLKNKSALVEKSTSNLGTKRSIKYNPETMQRWQQPKVEYKYKIGTEKEIHKQKYGLESAINNLGLSRNRLDALGGYLDGGEY